jgi:hypothetical protein
VEPSQIPLVELHWLAGLLEGEGSFMAGPPSNPRSPVISLNMTDEDIVSRVGDLFGRTPFVIQPRRENWSTSYQVRLTGRNAVAWMRALQPLLGQRRRAQIDRAVACYDPRPNQVLDDAAARSALQALAAGDAVKTVASRHGVSIWCIYDLRLGRTFKHLSERRTESRG